MNALDRRPCFQCAAAMRALPSGVLGPVDRPPCSRQRFLSLSGGFWHAVPRRVLASHICPCHSGPDRHGMPFSRLAFLMLKSPSFLGLYYTPFWVVWLGPCASVHGPRPQKLALHRNGNVVSLRLERSINDKFYRKVFISVAQEGISLCFKSMLGFK